MEELEAFFCNPRPSSSQVTKLRGPLTGGFRITEEDMTNNMNRREEHRHSRFVGGTDYAREARQKETEKFLKHEMEPDRYASTSSHMGFESLEQLSSWGASLNNIGELTEEAMTAVYSRYSFQRKEENKNLAIIEHKQKILDQIDGYPVVIIEGPTGCGKTTQVPQWILDECYRKRKPCKIIVTQPRRIAAISIAKRVAHERGWDVGGLVGYQVGLENKTSTDTRIHYVTTGILLQKLVATKNMNEYTHVILDEVHERGQEMDFLLLVVKNYLYSKSPNVKVILMSATFNRQAFADYFHLSTPRGLPTSVCVKVEKKEVFSVKIFYMNHLTKFGSIVQEAMPKDDPAVTPEMHDLVIRLLDAFEHIDKTEDKYLDRSKADLPSVLIFLPGINEIEDLYMLLENPKARDGKLDIGKYNWWVLPLHSTITAEEQVRVFQRAPPGRRKIILATNIAESSITVPDIKYVIDYCLMKIMVADEQTNFTSLQLHWASKNNCEQRAGRAGRVRDGRVYRLVPEKFYDNMAQECPPEIKRCPLERLVLLAKMLGLGSPSYTLGLAMDAPDISNIHRTILVLKELGGLKKLDEDEEWCTDDGEITYLGRIMAKLPLDVRASKLIVLGHIFGVLNESIIMAAAMSVKSLFSSPFQKRLGAYNSRLTWADGSTSDSIALYNVHKVWSYLRRHQLFNKEGNPKETEWASRSFVQLRALKELDDLVREIKQRLSREGIDTQKANSPYAKHETNLALKVLLAGAVYPQYFVQVSQDEAREREAVRTLGGLDPRNTVYLKEFPDNQPGEIYSAAIKRAVHTIVGDEPRVTFDKNSQKVYLTFGEDVTRGKRTKETSQYDPAIPGQIVLPVYKAIKARQLKMGFRIKLLPLETANAVAAALEKDKLESNKDMMVPRLPDIDDNHFPLKISQINTVSKFWVQYDDDSTTAELAEIQGVLNKFPLLKHTGPVKVGDVFAAPYVEANGTSLYRVRVMKLDSRNMVDVSYIDWGSKARLNMCDLYTLPPGVCADTPPLAMQCTLAEVAPSPLLDRHGQWSHAAEMLFQGFVRSGRLIGKVYSVTHGVVSVELFTHSDVSLNQELLKRKLAIACDESYDSKLNHDLRQTATEMNMAQKRAYNKEQAELSFYQLPEIEPPNAKDCISDIGLKGPFSPLETIVHNMMYASRDKQVAIEWNSVNSVLLDTEPQHQYERLLVAAEVGQNESSSKLTLRHTTMMPNIPGLPAIIALIFCPTAELRRDEAGTRYVSALCGLGSDQAGAPYFPEHDLLINIDADLSADDDIGRINHIRYLMDFMMYCDEGQDTPAESEHKLEVPTKIRTRLMELLTKRRKHREPQAVANAWEWKSDSDAEFLEMTDPGMVECAVIYPLHVPQELHPISKEQLLMLKKENEELKTLVSGTAASSSAELVCKLCGTPPMPTHAMRIHLYSNAHREKEEDFPTEQDFPTELEFPTAKNKPLSGKK